MRLQLLPIAWLIAVLVTACPGGSSHRSGATQPARTSKQPNAYIATLAIAMAATESDPWTSEIIATIGDELQIDPWAKATSNGHLDVYGPYEVVLDDSPAKLSIALSGIAGISDPEGQIALGHEVRDWLDEQQPHLVWLDGDQLQLRVGQELSDEQNILFTGVTIDREAFYNTQKRATGVYRRHSLPRVLGEIWSIKPEAKLFALLCDDSPLSISRVLKFKEYEAALPEDQGMRVMSPVTTWHELEDQLREIEEQVDAAIICGVGDEHGSLELREQDCPDDLLADIEIPVVVLGSSRADYCGALVLGINPAAHAKAALELARKIFKSSDPRALPTVTPDEMTAFRSERGFSESLSNVE